MQKCLDMYMMRSKGTDPNRIERISFSSFNHAKQSHCIPMMSPEYGIPSLWGIFFTIHNLRW